jgi:chromosome segregation ATPase
MVLTLTDGTIITIGPNDLKQLDFKKGDVTVSGTNITDLMNSIKDMQASLAAVQDNVAYALIQIKNNKEELQSRISALDASVTSSQKQIKDLQDNMSALQKDVANNKDELMEYYEETIDAYMNGESEISYTVTVEGINVVFQQYDIAAYAVGIITVPINYEKNKELFNTNYWI